MKKLLAILLAVVLMSSLFVGCNGGQQTADLGEFVDVDYKFNVEADKVMDSSDMPDWTGK